MVPAVSLQLPPANVHYNQASANLALSGSKVKGQGGCGQRRSGGVAASGTSAGSELDGETIRAAHRLVNLQDCVYFGRIQPQLKHAKGVDMRVSFLK